jgi:hypothetical protein
VENYFFPLSPTSASRGGTQTLDLEMMRRMLHRCTTASGQKEAKVRKFSITKKIAFNHIYFYMPQAFKTRKNLVKNFISLSGRPRLNKRIKRMLFIFSPNVTFMLMVLSKDGQFWSRNSPQGQCIGDDIFVKFCKYLI